MAKLNNKSEYVDVDGRQMLRGKSAQALRIGKLFDTKTGKLIGVFSERRLYRLASTLNLRGAKRKVPIDWNHGTFDGGGPEDAASLGFVEPGSATVRSDGLWITPVWSSRGEEIIRDAASLYFSVEFSVGADGDFAEAFDAETGEKIGSQEIIAIALTTTPRVDGMSAIALSDSPRKKGQEAPKMAKKAAPAEGAKKLAEAKVLQEGEDEEILAALKVMQEHCMALEAEIAELQAKLGAAEAEAAEAEVAAVETQNSLAESKEIAKLSEQAEGYKAEAKLLSERLAVVEEARFVEQKTASIHGLIQTGAILGSRKAFAEKLYDAEYKQGVKGVFAEFSEHAKKNPAVPLGTGGHSQSVDSENDREKAAKDLHALAQKLAAENKVSLYKGYQLAERQRAGGVQ